MATIERLDYGSDDGSTWGGTSTDKLAYYGGNPSVQVNLSSVANGGHVSSATASSQIIDFVSTMVEYFISTGMFRSS